MFFLARFRRQPSRDDPAVKRVLFVCTGNICRSPTAEGVARARLAKAGLARRVVVDSAGTHGYHAGEAPDPRAQKAARQRGFDLSRQRARVLVPDDFARFDLILAMDRGHLEILLAKCPPVHQHKVRLFMAYARQHSVDEVPDPYYGGPQGFDQVLDLCEDAVAGLLEELGVRV